MDEYSYILKDGNYYFSGKVDETEPIILNSINNGINLVLENAEIYNNLVIRDSNMSIIVKGTNKIEIDNYKPAISVINSTVTIKSEVENKEIGKLFLKGGNDCAGLCVVNSFVKFKDIDIEVLGGQNSVGIGSTYNDSNSFLEFENVKCLSRSGKGTCSPGIGSKFGTIKKISIYNSDIKATGTFAPGIGATEYGNVENIEIKNSIISSIGFHVAMDLGNLNENDKQTINIICSNINVDGSRNIGNKNTYMNLNGLKHLGKYKKSSIQ